MIKKICFLFTLIISTVAFNSVSEGQNTDSLKSLLPVANSEEKANLYLQLSKAWANENFDSCLHYARQALESAKAIKSNERQTDAYYRMADAYFYAYDYETAFQYYLESKNLAEKSGYDPGIANALNAQAIIYMYWGSYEQSEEWLRQSLDIYQQLNDRDGMANTYNNLGNLWLFAGKNKEASEYFERALAIKKESGKHEDVANALINLGNAMESFGDNKRAMEYYTQAYELSESTGNFPALIKSGINMGLILYNTGNYSEAIEYFQKSLTLSNERGDTESIAKALSSFAGIYYDIGDYDASLSYYQQVLKTYEQLKNPDGIASTFYNIGIIYTDLGENEIALQYFQDALQINRKTGNVKNMSNSLNSIGNLFEINGAFDSALVYFNEALSVNKAMDDREGMAATLHNLGLLFEIKEDYSKAAAFYNQSLEIERALGNEKGVAVSLQNIGTIYKNLKKFDLALKNYNHSIDIAQRLDLKNLLKSNYKNISEVYVFKENLAKALDFYIAYSNIKDSIFNEESRKQIAELETRYKTEKKEAEIQLLIKEQALQKAELARKNIFLLSLLGGVALIIALSFVLYKRYIEKRKANVLLHAQNEEIRKQKQEITDSIMYARNIQTAVLPPIDFLKDRFSGHFVLYKPRDIVSGDFYWMTRYENKIIVVAADCTGHGVPGAFMSMLGVTFLNEIIGKHNGLQAHDILNKLRDHIIRSLHQSGTDKETKDGMDISLCIFDLENMQLQFAGAYNPLYRIRNRELEIIDADRMPVGVSLKSSVAFKSNDIPLAMGDAFYIFSDGYVDQFGGPAGKKFNRKQFREILLDIQDKNMEEQKDFLDQKISQWMGNTMQIDDILVIGMKV